MAHRFKGLSDPARVRLLSLIAAHDGREACNCDLTGPIGPSQPTVSHHLKVLTEAGLLIRQQRGKWAYYRVADDVMRQIADAITPKAQ